MCVSQTETTHKRTLSPQVQLSPTKTLRPVGDDSSLLASLILTDFMLTLKSALTQIDRQVMGLLGWEEGCRELLRPA